MHSGMKDHDENKLLTFRKGIRLAGLHAQHSPIQGRPGRVLERCHLVSVTEKAQGFQASGGWRGAGGRGEALITVSTFAISKEAN